MAKAKIHPILALVDSAKSDDETRYFMDKGHYFAEGDAGWPCYVATDGRRLHVATFKADEKGKALEAAAMFGFKEDGYYDICEDRMVQNSLQAQFPNWNKVDPDTTGYESDEYNAGSPETALPIFCARNGMAFNTDYFKDFKRYLKGYGEVKIWFKDKGKAAVLRPVKQGCIQFRAVIMPMQID